MIKRDPPTSAAGSLLSSTNRQLPSAINAQLVIELFGLNFNEVIEEGSF